jgi:ATP-dependent phosphofructokinase / diphosphate-dependent phosphofructokinase
LKRVGILTGGGDCPGLNAVIRAAVKTAVMEYGFEVVGIEGGFDGLINRRTTPLTLDSIRGILPKGGTLLRTNTKGNPFSYPDANGVRVDRSEEALRNIKRLQLDGLIAIGGEGTLTIASRLHAMGAPIVGVPKTIDNDVDETDYSFGFMTAVAIATDAVDRLHSTAESHSRVMILEVMGRHAGWIALNSGIAGGADIILLPEIEYQPENIVRGIEARQARGSLFDVIVVAEGARRAGGEEVWVNKEQRRLGGVAYQVATEIQQHIDLEVRVTILGHIQRGGSPIAFDRILATRYGKAAADFIQNGAFGQMVGIQRDRIISVPMEQAIGRLKTVPVESEFIETARALGISFGDREP